MENVTSLATRLTTRLPIPGLLVTTVKEAVVSGGYQ